MTPQCRKQREANLDSSHLSHLAAQGLPAPGLHFPVSLRRREIAFLPLRGTQPLRYFVPILIARYGEER